jgi:SAM-dependent methyltransferase
VRRQAQSEADRTALIAARIRWTVRRQLPPRLYADDAVSEDGEPPLPEAAPLPPSSLELTDRSIDEELAADIDRLAASHDVRFPPARRERRLLAAPLSFFRRALYRLFAPFLAQQSEFNSSTARAAALLRDRSAQLRDHVLGHERDRQDRAMEELRHRIRSLERAVDRQLAERGSLRLDYFGLSERFRGSEGEIRKRQRRYVDVFRGGGTVLDLGCGRGEFLELLRDAGIRARGVDTTPAMIAHCRRKGLDVERRDAEKFLEAAVDGSLGGIFAAQVIEHLEPPTVVRLVQLAFRKLAPGGPLVLEAPNPATLSVLADFTLDPTHVRNYHPEFMKWLLGAEGFEEVELHYSLPVDEAVRLPPLEPRNGTVARVDRAVTHLNELLYASQAYAVIGWKADTRRERPSDDALP